SFSKYLKNPSYYEEAPFLSNAEDLCKALKEDLISTLIIVSASNGERKAINFLKVLISFLMWSYQSKNPDVLETEKSTSDNGLRTITPILIFLSMMIFL